MPDPEFADVIDQARAEHAACDQAVRILRLFVPGAAAPQGSKRHIGGGRMLESSKGVGPWRERVATFVHQEEDTPRTGPVSVGLVFVRPRPVATPKTRPTPPAVKKPDLDKLQRAVFDALTGISYLDDSQVTEIYARKRLAEIGETPGLYLVVRTDTGEIPVWVTGGGPDG